MFSRPMVGFVEAANRVSALYREAERFAGLGLDIAEESSIPGEKTVQKALTALRSTTITLAEERGYIVLPHQLVNEADLMAYAIDLAREVWGLESSTARWLLVGYCVPRYKHTRHAPLEAVMTVRL